MFYVVEVVWLFEYDGKFIDGNVFGDGFVLGCYDVLFVVVGVIFGDVDDFVDWFDVGLF